MAQSEGSSFSGSLKISGSTSDSYSVRNAVVGEGGSPGDLLSEDSGDADCRRRLLAATVATSQGASTSSAKMNDDVVLGTTRMSHTVEQPSGPPTGGVAGLPTEAQGSTRSSRLPTGSVAERGRAESYGVGSPEASHRGPSGSSEKIEACYSGGMRAALERASAHLRETSPYPASARTPHSTRPPHPGRLQSAGHGGN